MYFSHSSPLRLQYGAWGLKWDKIIRRMKRHMKVIESIWFNNIGIVKILDEDGNITFRIGLGFGIDQKMDEKKIMDWGNTFIPDDAFFKRER